MSFQWNPAIYHSTFGGVIYLPRPVEIANSPFRWKFDEHTVPLMDGGITYGHALQPVELTLQGSFGYYNSSIKLSEEEMWLAAEDFKSKLDAITESEKLEFFLFYNSGSGTYRKFKGVVPREFTPNFGDQTRWMFSYSLNLLCEDATIYSTAPGL